jgi:hypothetical protein
MRSVLVLAVLCQLAHAAPPGLTEEDPPAPTRTHEAAPPPGAPALEPYRAQIILADALAGTMMFIAVNSSSDGRAEAFAKLGMTAYVVGGPIVHLTKDRGKRALGSITLRLSLPIVGVMLAGALTDHGDCYGCGDNNEAVLGGLLLGAIAASAIDAGLIAKGEPAKQPQAAWTPTVRATQGGLALGVGGRF